MKPQGIKYIVLSDKSSIAKSGLFKKCEICSVDFVPLLFSPKTEYRGVRREIWTRLNGGWFLEHLTSDGRFPDSPSAVQIIPTFTPPKNYANFYGQRLQAYFVPPESGNYGFHATCDSECAFYLSVDEKPGNKKELIRIDQQHRTGYDQWDR